MAKHRSNKTYPCPAVAVAAKAGKGLAIVPDKVIKCFYSRNIEKQKRGLL